MVWLICLSTLRFSLLLPFVLFYVIFYINRGQKKSLLKHYNSVIWHSYSAFLRSRLDKKVSIAKGVVSVNECWFRRRRQFRSWTWFIWIIMKTTDYIIFKLLSSTSMYHVHFCYRSLSSLRDERHPLATRRYVDLLCDYDYVMKKHALE